MRGVLVTGASGGIGSAISAAFQRSGWRVVATDRDSATAGDAFIPADLERIATDDEYARDFHHKVMDALDGAPLAALVNNAALQILASASKLSAEDWQKTLAVNLIAPFRLSQAFLRELKAAKGTIVNIGSVHAQATKKGFAAYATSKAALHGLTRALAVDLGPDVRVVCIAPAAVATDMLYAGFTNNPEGLSELAASHPLNRIGMPPEIAAATVAITEEPFLFLTGSVVWLDGGVLSRLHDPA